MVERTTPDNPIQPRYAGMMAVLRNGDCFGPLRQFTISKGWFCLISKYDWLHTGESKDGPANIDIIAVLPMPDMSGLEGE